MKVLVSHRQHPPLGEDIALRIDRVIAPRFVVRRPESRGLVVDDRVTAPLGRGLPDARARLILVLDGRVRLRTREGRALELGAGDVVLRSRIDAALEQGFGASLEIDFESDASVPSLEVGRLGAASMRALASLADATRHASPAALPVFVAHLDRAQRALAAEGWHLPLHTSADATSEVDQALMTALDHALSDLSRAPALVDLQNALACDRRTIVRRTRSLHERHALSGFGGADFRAVRDFYRLLVACIFASSPHATTESVARAVGYGAPAALCHAFQRVGLPAPGAVRALVRD